MKRIIQSAGIFLIAAVSAHANLVSISFVGSTGGVVLPNSHTASLTTNGITMLFTAFATDDANALLKGGNNWLGVDSLYDLASDKVETNEFITITFSSSVYSSITLQSISLGAVNGGDNSYYQIDSGTLVSIAGANGVRTNGMPVEVLGKTLTYALSSQSSTAPGAALTGISLDTIAIPEPATVSMFGIAGMAVFLIRRSFHR